MPRNQYGTIQALSGRHKDLNGSRNSSGRVPLTAAQKKDRQKNRVEKQERIDSFMRGWRAETRAKATAFAEEIGRDERFVLDLMFENGAKFVKEHEKTNSFNAFKSIRTTEMNEG